MITRRSTVFIAMLALVGGLAFAQDLKIEYRYNVGAADPAGNFISFIGPIRYMSADKDQVDMVTGASRQLTTQRFMPYLLDVKGKNVFPNGLRGLFNFAVNPFEARAVDNLSADKTSDGTITVRYVHRGVAYEMATDRTGRFTFPEGSYRARAIGFIKGAGPQVLHRDFSANGTVARIDWTRVWDAGIASGKTIAAGVANKTGAVVRDGAAGDSFFYWQGSLQATLENDILKITGGLNAVKR